MPAMKTVSRFRELRNGFPVIVGAFMLCFIVDGITYSFGILMLELLAEFNDSRGKTALVGSVLTGAQLLGPLFGCLCERFGMLPVVMLGSLLSCAGFVGASFSTRLLQLYVLYGIVAGIGLAMLLLMANVCIIKTFKKNASLAAGIAVCGSGAVGLAFWVPFHLLPDQVNEINSSRQIATWIVSSIGIANIFGRVLFGWLGDFRRIRRIMLATGILFALGITTGSSPFLTSVETKLFYGCSFGLLIGGFFALLPVVLSDLFGADVITRTLGMAMFTIGLSASVATPIGGFIRDTTGSYTASFLVSGGEFLLAAGGFALASCLKGPAPQ